MIVADTSVLIAILFEEPDGERYAAAIEAQDRVLVAAPSAFEFQLVVIRRRGLAYLRAAELILKRTPIEIVDWTADHVSLATVALERFGGRPARLNFGDCMAYAVAKSLDAPLLYKGGDFAATDIRSALPPAS